MNPGFSDPIPPALISDRAPTRSGYLTAKFSAYQPPRLIPRKATLSSPRASRAPRNQSAGDSDLKESRSGLLKPGSPGISRQYTLNRSANKGITPSQEAELETEPWRSTRGGLATPLSSTTKVLPIPVSILLFRRFAPRGESKCALYAASISIRPSSDL